MLPELCDNKLILYKKWIKEQLIAQDESFSLAFWGEISLYASQPMLPDEIQFLKYANRDKVLC